MTSLEGFKICHNNSQFEPSFENCNVAFSFTYGGKEKKKDKHRPLENHMASHPPVKVLVKKTIGPIISSEK